MIDLLQHEAATGCRRLIGARLAGTLPVSETVLNELVSRLGQAPPGLALEVHPSNRIVARYGVVRATAVLDDEVRVGSGPPLVTLQLASVMVAWTLSRMIRVPAVQIDGRRVTIEVGALEGIGAFRYVWPHLSSVRLRTTNGYVHVDFAVAVTDAPVPPRPTQV